ncbi:hypothetical protein [Egicoccus sp. AB-alg2]|uniref:hypothetical protein n=1 Tax=Egicoccus sp. AB-alg2 TaxID=3242693 RepID=UPI00359E1815
MTVVWYEEFRRHDERRIAANDSMMALLAGSKLAAHTLQLNQGSNHRLSELFPSVPHIRRLDITTESAQEILEDAEGQLGAMAVPYVLALHEDLVVGMGSLLLGEGLISKQRLAGLKSANMHACLEEASKQHFSVVLLDLFHLVRLSRNAHIHSGGRAESPLVNRITKVAESSFSSWEAFTGDTFPRYSIGDKVRLGLPELIGCLAVTKRLAEEANQFLQSAISRATWADMVVAEWRREPSPGNPAQTLRKVRGLARHRFAALSLSEDELKQALGRAQ